MLETLSDGQILSVLESIACPAFVVAVGAGNRFRYLGINPAMMKATGLGAADITGKVPHDVFPHAQAGNVQANYARCVETRGPIHYEQCLEVGGSAIWWSTALMPLVAPDGRVHRIIGTSFDITAQKAMEVELRRSRAFLQATLDHIPAMIFCKEAPDLRYTLLNRTGERYFGQSKEEVIGRRDQDMYPAEMADAFRATDLEVLATGRPATVIQHAEIGGERRRVRTRKVAIPGADGRPRYVLGVAEDVTESHKAEVLLRDAIDSLRDGFVLFDRNDRLVLHNGRFVEFYPYLKKMLPLEGRTFQELVQASREWRVGSQSPEVIERYMGWRIAHWRDGSETPIEQELPGDRWVLISERPTADGGIVAIHTDITAQKKAEVRLLEAIESIDQGFILTDADDRVVLSNRRIREMFPEVGAHIVPGAHIRDLIRIGTEAGDYQTDYRPIEETVEAIYHLYRYGTAEGIERRLRDGRWILFSQHVTASGLRVGLRTDITLLKVRQQQLTEIRDHLQRQTAELMRLTGDLRLARQRAEDASQAKSQFLAMISHELRTPFTGIRGMADLLAGTGLEEEQLRYLDVMRRSLDRLLMLLDQILDFSRIEAGRIELTESRMSPARLIADAVAIFAAGAEVKGITLQVSIAPDVPEEVISDPAKTTQILANLVGNAVKFTESGTITIALAVERDGDRAFLCWTVEDTGIGLSPDEIRRLFEPFMQADASTSRRFGGTGLGLAISKRLVEAMGGSIGVSSVPEGGSRFRFRTPLRSTRPAASPAPAAQPTPPSAAASEPSGAVLRVLVAEDDAVNQMLLDAMLKRWGFDACIVGDGQAALDQAATGGFDAVLMDVNMPVMDGPTAMRGLRGMAAGKDLPILALTADVLPEHIQRYRDAGFTDVLTKPVDWNRLRTLLEGLPVRSG